MMGVRFHCKFSWGYSGHISQCALALEILHSKVTQMFAVAEGIGMQHQGVCPWASSAQSLPWMCQGDSFTEVQPSTPHPTRPN